MSAVWVIGYLFVGCINAAGMYAVGEHLSEEDRARTGGRRLSGGKLMAIVVAWPLLIAAFVGFAVVDILFRFDREGRRG